MARLLDKMELNPPSCNTETSSGPRAPSEADVGENRLPNGERLAAAERDRRGRELWGVSSRTPQTV